MPEPACGVWGLEFRVKGCRVWDNFAFGFVTTWGCTAGGGAFCLQLLRTRIRIQWFPCSIPLCLYPHRNALPKQLGAGGGALGVE